MSNFISNQRYANHKIKSHFGYKIDKHFLSSSLEFLRHVSTTDVSYQILCHIQSYCLCYPEQKTKNVCYVANSWAGWVSVEQEGSFPEADQHAPGSVTQRCWAEGLS